MAKGMPTGAKPKAHYPRRVHDFSARRVYTTKAGLINVVKPMHSVPNEHFDIDVSDFLQSMPLSTAAFLRGRKEFAFYYVPYVQLWSNFGQYVSGRADKFSSALKGHEKEPRISLRLLYILPLFSMLNDLTLRFTRPNEETRTTNWNALDFQWNDRSLGANPKVYDPLSNSAISSRLNVYLAQTNNSFRRVVNNVEELFVPTKAEFAYDRFGLARWSNMVRKLDMLRYGNLIPVFSPFYDAVVAYFKGDVEVPTSTLDRLFLALLHEIDIIPENYYVSPFSILAYNKIYYTFFRNSYYELDYYVGDYNVDSLNCDSLETSLLTNDMFSIQFLDMYQHQWKKDAFTSLMPDTQFGAVSQVELTSDGIIQGNGDIVGYIDDNTVISSLAKPQGDNRWLNTQNQNILTDTGGIDQGLRGLYSGSEGQTQRVNLHGQLQSVNVWSPEGDVDGLSVSGTSSFDVLALRRAEAIQGYRQTLLRCGNKTKDIMVGIYGVEPVWENDHDPAFIDAFGFDFAVDRIMQTATTDDSVDTYNGKLGDLGGQIARLGGSKHHIRFTTHGDFGVIMPVCYTIFESEYNSYNIDQNNLTLTPEDRFIPDYMNLGFVPVTRRALSLLDPVVNRTGTIPSMDSVLGYGTRYWEKKIDIDLVHGILCSFGVFDPEHPDTGLNRDIQYFGDFSHWVAPRTDMQSALVTSTKQFYIDPRILNGNFLIAADGRQETDQFICNTYFKVKRTNILSDLGLPQF